MKRNAIFGLLLTVCSLMTIGCKAKEPEGTTIVDSAGDKVLLPNKIERVVVTTEPAVDMMVALGLEDKISGAYKNVYNNPWLDRFWEHGKETDKIQTYQPEAESLIASNTDVIFVPTKERADALRDKGICAVTLRMFSPKEVKEGIQILGQIFGEETKSKGNEWIADFQKSIDDISSKVKDISFESRKSCYQLMGDKYKGLFRTNYGDTLDYFVYGGGRSALSEIEGTFTDHMPTEESVLGTNPDVIFVNGTYASRLIGDLKTDQRWSTINAVVNDEIYRTPLGFSDWSNEGSELILMNYWVFSKLYPSRCDFDMKKISNDFYKKYFDVTFTDEELTKMFNILSPEGNELCK